MSFTSLPLPHLSFPGQYKFPPHPLFVLRRRGLSHCEEAFSFWLPRLDVTLRENTRVWQTVEGRRIRAWTGLEIQGAMRPCLWFKDQPVCKELTVPNESQSPATQLPSPGSLLWGLFCLLRTSHVALQEPPAWDTAHHAWGTESLGSCKWTPCLSAKSALSPCYLKTILAGNSPAIFLM